jgi:hypothetical protein
MFYTAIFFKFFYDCQELVLKPEIRLPLQKWWDNARKNYHPEEIITFLQRNKDKLEESFVSLDGKNRLYNAFNHIFSFFSFLAEIADQISEKVQGYLMNFSSLRGRIVKARDWKNQLNFREFVEFGRAKLYSLRLPPQNEKAIKLLEEIMEFGSKHGLDLNQHFPNARQIILEKKNQFLQHKFFQEFSKSRLEQLLAIQFAFDRSLFPVLPDSAFWHKFFEYLERKMVIDIILVNKDNHRFSFKHSDPREIESTDVINILGRVSEIKNKGHRVFFVGHHEGYLGPYFVRSVIRKLGFDNLTRNCNTIVGPRMFSNLVLRNGAANVGNLFVTVPSQKTTAIKTKGLAEALKKTARQTQFLIKFPDAGLYLIKKLELDEFKEVIQDTDLLEQHTAFIEAHKKEELKRYIQDNKISKVMQGLKRDDYTLFKKIMRECFLIFPEGSRSNTDPDGAVSMKYVNPRYLKVYMRPGDFIVPVNLVGGSDVARGWRLRPAKLGLSLDDPFEVTESTIKNYQTEGLDVMRKIAALPNIKEVRFTEK